ncbi:MAG: HD domain-containing protein [Gemmatimonadetes bacterium]|nr:HD domain-containing protein [Gemmatimonadota bacterium]MDA1103626.1 HD domain-containing protein [Gemmatimonadota bacterium]
MTGTHSGKAFYAGLLEALTGVMGSAKGYLNDHGPRVAMLATQLGSELGLNQQQRSELVFGAVLSDMGMVGLAEDAWENPVAELSDEVRARVRQHPQRSEMRAREVPHLESLGPLIRHHHEWWDGSGYPDGFGGEDIPLGAQILRLADTVTALGAPRPQREALGREKILDIVESGIGVEFSPTVANTYLRLMRTGEIPQFTDAAYRHTVLRATEHLLPEEVSPPSTNQLLTIVANLIDAKDPYTGGHSRRVALLAVSVADQLGLEGHIKSALWSVGYLHDLGKLAVPLRVLAKEGKLTDEEFEFIKAHPTDGAEILEGIPTLRHLTTGVRYHHERWDGGGYPEGLSGDRIPLVAQIMAVCDAYDAMTSKRAYRNSVASTSALEEVARERGKQFGPVAADGFLAIPSDIFEGLHGSRPEAFRDIPQRVQTLRHIDPRWFTSEPVHRP